MTLIVTAVTPDGIVIGTDSALTWKETGEEIVLTNFPKIIKRGDANEAIAIAGSARRTSSGPASG